MTLIPEPDHPKWRAWREDCLQETERLLERVAAGGKPLIKKLYQRKAVADLFYFARNGPFQGQCAICQASLSQDGATAHLVHFRPPLPLVDQAGQSLMVETEQGSQPHPGYYWLAYHWRNLFPACGPCAALKRFPWFPTLNPPAAGPQVSTADEEPLLLNPHFDLVGDHLAADPCGLLIAKTERGRAWIQRFQLNLRDGLPEARLKARLQSKAVLLKNAMERIAWRESP